MPESSQGYAAFEGMELTGRVKSKSCVAGLFTTRAISWAMLKVNTYRAQVSGQANLSG